MKKNLSWTGFLDKIFYRWGSAVTAFSIFGMLFVFPVTTLVPTALIIFGVIGIFQNKEFRKDFIRLFLETELQWIAYPFAFWFCAEVIVAAIHPTGLIQEFPSNALRIFLSLTLLCFSARRDEAIKYFTWGLVTAGLAAALWGGFELAFFDDVERAQGTTNNPIHFGNLTAVVALLCLSISVLSAELDIKFRFLLLSAMGLATFASLTSFTRSSVIVLICVTPLIFVSNKDKFHRYILRVFCIGLLIVFSAVIFSSRIQERLRINEFTAAFDEPEKIDYSSLTSGRAGMWQASFLLFKEHPIVGVGSDEFKLSLESLVASRVVIGDPYSQVLHNQPHNDILYAASTGGVIKLIAYLALIACPFRFFYQRYKKVRDNISLRVVPILGMQTIAAYFLTGLTNSNFDLQIYCTTYAVLICLFAKISIQKSDPAG